MTTALEGGEGSASRPGRSLPTGKTRCTLHRRLGGSQGRSGHVPKISSQTGVRNPDRSDRSQSLYLLRYPAHHQFETWMEIWRLFLDDTKNGAFYLQKVLSYLKFRNKSIKWTRKKYVLSQIINYQDISVAFTIIIRVDLQKLSKHFLINNVW